MTGEPYRGFRVSIVGGCQVAGLRDWTRRLLPGASVECWHIGSGRLSTPAEVLPRLMGSDLVVTQFSAEMDHGDELGLASLQPRCASVVFMPVFVFGGFHPDIVFTGRRGEPFALVRGPLDVLQSAIALAAYHLGVPSGRVPRLYNALVFDVLGYTHAFEAARAACVKVYADHGYDIADPFAQWLKDGCFMYCDNHPHIRVLGSFAALILAKARLATHPVAAADVPPDQLSDSVQWPVYPALARRLGVPGSTVFTRALHSVEDEHTRGMGLHAFVDASYAAFDSVGRDNLDPVPRVLADMDALRPLISL